MTSFFIILCGTDGLISLPFLRLVPQRVRDGEPDEERKGKQRQVHHQETNQQEENEWVMTGDPSARSFFLIFGSPGTVRLVSSVSFFQHDECVWKVGTQDTENFLEEVKSLRTAWRSFLSFLFFARQWGREGRNAKDIQALPSLIRLVHNAWVKVWRWRWKAHAFSPSTSGHSFEKTSVIQTRRQESIALSSMAPSSPD